MTEDERREIMLRLCEGARAMSSEELKLLQRQQLAGMQQRGPLSSEEAAGLRNFWRGTTDEQNTAVPYVRPTLWQRFQAWRERTGFFMDGSDGGM